MTIYKNGFSKQGLSYGEAFQFLQKHSEYAEIGCVMGIDVRTSEIRVSPINRDDVQRTNRSWGNQVKMLISDDLPGGIHGMINHADGKRYDSKSQYEKAVRAKGCRIVGNDWNNKDMRRKEIYGSYNVRPQLKQAIEKVIGS